MFTMTVRQQHPRKTHTAAVKGGRKKGNLTAQAESLPLVLKFSVREIGHRTSLSVRKGGQQRRIHLRGALESVQGKSLQKVIRQLGRQRESRR